MPYVSDIIDYLKRTSPAQDEFYQTCEELLMSLRPLLDTRDVYRRHKNHGTRAPGDVPRDMAE